MKSLVYEKLADKKNYIYINNLLDMKKSNYAFFDNHIHKSIEMVVCYGGTLSYRLNDSKGIIRKGQILITNSYDRHFYEYIDNASIVILVFSKDLIEDVFENQDYEFNNIITVGEEDFEKVLYLTFLFENLNDMSYIDKKATIFNIFATLYRYNLVKKKEYSKEKNDVLRILEYIELNYSNNISLDSVAKNFGYSKNYFSHIFNKMIGSNFNYHINSYRAEKVLEMKSLEEYKNVPLAKIIKLCGFNSKETYYRVLRNYKK